MRKKKGENHSDPIYTNPIKNLPNEVCPNLAAAGSNPEVGALNVRWGRLLPQTPHEPLQLVFAFLGGLDLLGKF